MLPIEIPITPDGDEARRWAEEELSRSEYAQGESWIDVLERWLEDFFNGLDNPFGRVGLGGIPDALLWIVIASIVAGIVLYLVLGPLRQARRARASTAVFDDDERSIDELRAAIVAAEDSLDWSAAAIERFRLIVRLLDERGVVSVVPGMTALECALAAHSAAPASARELDWAADLFDGIRYGHAAAIRSDAERMATLERALASVGSPA